MVNILGFRHWDQNSSNVPKAAQARGNSCCSYAMTAAARNWVVIRSVHSEGGCTVSVWVGLVNELTLELTTGQIGVRTVHFCVSV